MELRGEIEACYSTGLAGNLLGDLHYSPVLFVGHHILYGKIIHLEKPVVVVLGGSLGQQGGPVMNTGHPLGMNSDPFLMATSSLGGNLASFPRNPLPLPTSSGSLATNPSPFPAGACDPGVASSPRAQVQFLSQGLKWWPHGPWIRPNLTAGVLLTSGNSYPSPKPIGLGPRPSPNLRSGFAWALDQTQEEVAWAQALGLTQGQLGPGPNLDTRAGGLVGTGSGLNLRMAGSRGLDLAPILRAAGLSGANSAASSKASGNRMAQAHPPWQEYLTPQSQTCVLALREVAFRGPNLSPMSRALVPITLIQFIFQGQLGPWDLAIFPRTSGPLGPNPANFPRASGLQGPSSAAFPRSTGPLGSGQVTFPRSASGPLGPYPADSLGINAAPFARPIGTLGLNPASFPRMNGPY
ncbi:hypothetical protein GH733_011867, partial [Mirounga leonina]